VAGLFTLPLRRPMPRDASRNPRWPAVSRDANACTLRSTCPIARGTGRRHRQGPAPVGCRHGPYDVVLAGHKAYVSNWGGRQPSANDVTGPAGKARSSAWTRCALSPVKGPCQS